MKISSSVILSLTATLAGTAWAAPKARPDPGLTEKADSTGEHDALRGRIMYDPIGDEHQQKEEEWAEQSHGPYVSPGSNVLGGEHGQAISNDLEQLRSKTFAPAWKKEGLSETETTERNGAFQHAVQQEASHFDKSGKPHTDDAAARLLFRSKSTSGSHFMMRTPGQATEEEPYPNDKLTPMHKDIAYRFGLAMKQHYGGEVEKGRDIYRKHSVIPYFEQNEAGAAQAARDYARQDSNQLTASPPKQRALRKLTHPGTLKALCLVGVGLTLAQRLQCGRMGLRKTEKSN